MFAPFVALLLAPPLPIPTYATDIYGDPLPEGAVARFGTVRFRHIDTVIALTFLPDGKTLIAADEGGHVILWDVNSGKRLREYPELDAVHISDVAFAPDGKTAVIAAEDADRLWDVAQGAEVRSSDHPVGEYDAASIASDGSVVVSGEHNNIVIWDRATGQRLRRCEGPQRELPEALGHPREALPEPILALSGDGKVLVSSSLGVNLWEIKTGKRLLSLPGPVDGDGPARAIAILRNAQEMIVADPDRRGLAWLSSRSGAKRLHIATRTKVLRLLVSPNGKLLAGSDDEGGITLWDATTGAERHRLPRGERRRVGPMAFSADGGWLAAGSGVEVRVWEMATGKPIGTTAGHGDGITAVAYSPDSKIIATSSHDGTVRLWDRTSARELRCLPTPKTSVNALVFAPDGKSIGFGGHDGIVYFWDVANGKELRRFGKADEKEVDALAFSPDGSALAACKGDAIVVWEARTAKELRRFPTPTRLSFSLSWSPDGKALAVAPWWGNAVPRWDVSTGEELSPLAGGDSSVVFSPDGRWMATSSERAAAMLFDAKTGQEIRPLRIDGIKKGLSGELAYAVSPDGRTLAVSAEDTDAVILLEVASGEVRRRIERPRGSVWAIAFSPDGRRLVTGCDDSTALVWNLWTPPHRRPAISAALWQDLAQADARAAHDAMTTLAASPRAAVALLAEKLAPAKSSEADRVRRLIADLDSDDFATRERATQELADLGDTTEPALRRTLTQTNSAEVRRRLERLLDKLESPERLQQVRALEVLEHIDTSQARDVLRRLAQGARDAWLTKEAAATLSRRAK